MSEKNEKPVTNSATPMSVAERYSLHETVALKIFMEEISLVPSRGGVHQAKRAFNLAKGFVDVAASVRAGTFEPVDPVSEQPKMKKVVYVDDETGEKIERMEPEQDFCCPNLPPDHPINQRAREYSGPVNANIGP